MYYSSNSQVALNDFIVLTQYGAVEAGFHGEVGKDVRKVKLPEVTKEEAEATFVVVFTTPLKRLGLVDAHKHTKRASRTQNRVKWRRAPLF